jgi:chemotaxis protein CheD
MRKDMAKLVVGIGEYAVSRNPEDEIKTYALGSCIAVVFLDPRTRVAGMAHIALPESSTNLKKAQELPCYFADTGIPYLLERMKEAGSPLHAGYLVKLVGGANVLKDNDQFLIGERNLTAIKKMLWKYNLAITAQDVGKDFSRTVSVLLKTGKLTIASAAGETWSI